MKPYDMETAEAELHAAIDADDRDDITKLERIINDLDVRPQVSLHSAALWYAEQGLKIFPLSPGSKVPLKGSGGCKDATTDRTLIDSWWTGNPNCNIGLATGFLVDVVDIDGLEGQVSRAANWNLFDSLRIVGQVSTPRPGGLHLYVPARPGMTNGAGILPKIDYRGLGGYVVAPPSRTEIGAYTWVRPIDMETLTSASGQQGAA